MSRVSRRTWAGARGRAFRRSMRHDADLANASAVIVVGVGGDLTLIAAHELDRPGLAAALVSLAFNQVDDIFLDQAPASGRAAARSGLDTARLSGAFEARLGSMPEQRNANPAS